MCKSINITHAHKGMGQAQVQWTHRYTGHTGTLDTQVQWTHRYTFPFVRATKADKESINIATLSNMYATMEAAIVSIACNYNPRYLQYTFKHGTEDNFHLLSNLSYMFS